MAGKLLAKALGKSLRSKVMRPVFGAVDGVPGARYWRVFVKANNGNATYISFTELEFYTDAGKYPTVGGTVIKSSETGTAYASKLFNGNLTDSWNTSTPANEWAGYAFAEGEAPRISAVVITGPIGSAATTAPKDYDVQYSLDGTTWITAWSVTGAVNWGQYEVRSSSDPTVQVTYAYPKRYWRIYINQVAGGSGVAEVNEVKFNVSSGVSADMTGGVAIRSSANGGSVAANAFDGSTTTIWTSTAASPQWVGYDFGAAKSPEITEVQIHGNGGRAPRDFIVQSSGDGIRWNDEWVIYDRNYWVSEWMTFPKPPNPNTDKSRWRIYITGTSNGGTSPEMAELAFYRAGDVVVPLNFLPLKSSQFGASRVERIFDGGTASGVWTANGSVPQWAGYDFGTPEEVVKVVITAGSDTGRAPRDFDVQWSKDGSTWTTAWSVTGSTWTAGQTKTFTKP